MKDEAAGIIAAIEDVKRMLNQRAANSTDTKAIDELTAKLSNTTSAATEQLSALREVVEAARKPLVKENRHTIDIQSKSSFALMVGMFAAIILLAITTHHALEPNRSEQHNDLKYRTICMYGGATPKDIANLEELFSTASPKELRTLRKKVEAHEQAVQKQAEALEISRLKQLEAEQLDNEAENIKSK